MDDKRAPVPLGNYIGKHTIGSEKQAYNPCRLSHYQIALIRLAAYKGYLASVLSSQLTFSFPAR
ncbi:hypothetical protein HMPREF1640_07495 [Prevotella sp. S7-1-8]|nr:hypothetical protein HMPREF1640_07495 [Prevotella sp. S7-1-8]